MTRRVEERLQTFSLEGLGRRISDFDGNIAELDRIGNEVIRRMGDLNVEKKLEYMLDFHLKAFKNIPSGVHYSRLTAVMLGYQVHHNNRVNNREE